MGPIEGLKEYLPELGKHLAIDSKKIKSYARGKRKKTVRTLKPTGHMPL